MVTAGTGMTMGGRVVPRPPVRAAHAVAAVTVAVGIVLAGTAPVQARDVERNSERASRASASQQAQARVTRLFAVAKSLRGTPYRYGGTTPRGFDCSGYVTYVLARVGVTGLPRNSAAIRRALPRISRAQARPGDLIFFHSSRGHVHHVGFYAGGNMLWDSPSSGGRVALRPIWSSRVSFGRVIG